MSAELTGRARGRAGPATAGAPCRLGRDHAVRSGRARWACSRAADPDRDRRSRAHRPKIRDRGAGESGEPVRFTSAILPAHPSRARNIDELLPSGLPLADPKDGMSARPTGLYPKGVSTGQFEGVGGAARAGCTRPIGGDRAAADRWGGRRHRGRRPRQPAPQAGGARSLAAARPLGPALRPSLGRRRPLHAIARRQALDPIPARGAASRPRTGLSTSGNACWS
jgi:hypothetical protein